MTAKTSLKNFDIARLEKLAKIVRGLAFAAIESAKSGHPGGSSSKVEQFLTLTLGGFTAFDAMDPKNPGRDRFVWSAGHCSPLLYGGLALFYECMRRTGRQFSPAAVQPVFPEDLVRFRKPDGPQGHTENYSPLSDVATGSSAHGFSAAGGLALLHKSCGLETKVWVMMGDAESEEGVSYECRNIAATAGLNNLIVSLDYNHIGSDGDVGEVISTPYADQWKGMGWNVIEVDGHDFVQLFNAYEIAKNNHFEKPTVIVCHTIKGKNYGKMENSASSHGTPATHEEYVEIIKKLGFDIPGINGNVFQDIEVILNELKSEDENFIAKRLEAIAENIKAESKLEDKIKIALSCRPLVNPRLIKRPSALPKELTFEEGSMFSTRKAVRPWLKWLMEQSAFVYAGSGDLSKSIYTDDAEKIYGIISKKNPFGRGIRFGIAEQNMTMMSTAISQDILPGGFQPISIFGTFSEFTTIVGNCIRMALINNHLMPDKKGFFIMIASHDGPETGEDGPTAQGLFWMSLYNAYPGIKVYKPFDANETIEMLFHALNIGEPIVLSASRQDTPVLKREGNSTAKDAINGAYIFHPFNNNGGKKIVLAISGSQLLQNVIEILPDLEKRGFDVKIIAVTSPQLFEELCVMNPKKAKEILSDEERASVITMHNGWPGFLYPFILPPDYRQKAMGINQFLKSGNPKEVYELAGFTPKNILSRILDAI